MTAPSTSPAAPTTAWSQPTTPGTPAGAGAPTGPPPPSGPPLPAPTPARPSPPRRPWRQRLPEIVATIGAALVVAALVGFLSSTWDVLGPYGKSLVLAATAVGLTVAGLWGDQTGRRTFAALVPTVWTAATAALVGAVTLAGLTAAPDLGRVAIAVGGLAGAGLAATLWARRPDALLLQLTVAVSALYAAGPLGSALGDRFTADSLPDLAIPLAGLLDPTWTSDLFVVTGVVHAVIGVAWLALARPLSGRPALAARIGGSAVLAYSAMQLNVLTAPIGAAAALLIVLGYLVYGLASEDGLLVVLGSVGALISGVRVLTALFSGEIAVTVTVFAAGLAMLAWALRAARRRGDDADDPAH